MKNKGSILFLAMVIMSVVLAAGLGVSVVLLRQIREAGGEEEVAIAFYVADTVIDEISSSEEFEEGVWKIFSFEEVEREIEYKGESLGDGEYRITVNVGDEYYIFHRKVSDEENGNGIKEDIFTIHYNNPNNWEEVYLKYEENGTYPCVSMSESGEWFKYDIDATTMEKTRAIFYDDSGCPGVQDGVYPNLNKADDYWYLEEVAKIFITGEGSKEDIFTIHYNNPNNWEEVYLKYEENGTYPCVSMSESGEWFKYDIDATTMEKTRAIFYDDSGCPGVQDGVYPNLNKADDYWHLEEVSEIYILGEFAD